jgi:hypothetical protein
MRTCPDPQVVLQYRSLSTGEAMVSMNGMQIHAAHITELLPPREVTGPSEQRRILVAPHIDEAVSMSQLFLSH